MWTDGMQFLILVLVIIYIRIGLRTVGDDILEGYHAAKNPDRDSAWFLSFMLAGVLLWPAIVFFGVGIDSQDRSRD
jgi:hypothetical protein